MPSATLPLRATTAPRGSRSGAVPYRAGLAAATILALAGAAVVAIRAPTVAVELDLARVIRVMALIKGGFALAALGACLWRLARPAVGWRLLAYLAGPPLMAAGAVVLWSLQMLGPAALGLHLGLFALLAAGLTDRDFIPTPARSR